MFLLLVVLQIGSSVTFGYLASLIKIRWYVFAIYFDKKDEIKNWRKLSTLLVYFIFYIMVYNYLCKYGTVKIEYASGIKLNRFRVRSVY